MQQPDDSIHQTGGRIERPDGVRADWLLCQCGIDCTTATWVSRSTFFRHQKAAREKEQAIQQQRPIMASGRGLRHSMMQQQRAREAAVQSAATSSRTLSNLQDTAGSQDEMEVVSPIV